MICPAYFVNAFPLMSMQHPADIRRSYPPDLVPWFR